MNGIRPSPRTLGEIPRWRALQDPERVAVVDGDITLTYAELAEEVDATAALLERLKIASGDRVGLLLRNSAAFVTSEFGIARAGAVVVPLSTRLSAPEVRFLVEHSGCRLVLYDDTTYELARTALHESDAILLDVDHRREKAPRVASTNGPSPEEDAAIFYTSGTTDNPKGVQLSHRAILHCMTAVSEFYDVSSNDVTLALLPLYHTATHFAAWPTLLQGGTVIVHEGFRAEDAYALLERYRVTLFPTVTAIAVLLAKHFATRGIRPDLSALRKLYVGGAAVPDQLLSDWASFAPEASIVNCYGLTEMSPAVAAMDPARGSLKMRSVGRCYRDIEVQIADEGDDGVGEIVVRGPSMMTGYWRNPEETAATIVDGWLRTGDLGYLDDDGDLYIVGRKKHMIKRGGENVFPNEVEAVLARANIVREAVVVAVPDDVMGERVGAIVSLQPGAHITPQAVAERCARELAAFKVPEYIAIVDGELPKNAVGKIDARTLFERALRGEIEWTDLRRGSVRQPFVRDA